MIQLDWLRYNRATLNMIDRVPVSQMKQISSDPQFTVIAKTQPGLPDVVFLNTAIAPTNDLAVRQAVNYATNQEAICAVGEFGTTTPANGPLWKSTPYYSAAAADYKFDLEKAKQILDNAGWKVGSDGIRSKNGQRLTLVWASTAYSSAFDQLLQSQWRAAGVELKIDKMTATAALAAITNNKCNVFGNSWNASDPVILNNLFLSSNIKDGYAWSKYASPAIDAALEAGEKTLDTQKRTQEYAKVQKLIMDQALIVPLFGVLMNDGIQSKYKGAKLDFRGYEWLYDVNLT